MKDISTAGDILEVSCDACDLSSSDFTITEIAEILEEIMNDESGDFELALGNRSVRLIDDDVIEQIWENELGNQLDEQTDDVPSFIVIDREETIENLKIDGEGHHFGSYDGNEHSAHSCSVFRTA